MTTAKRQISIIVPVFNSEQSINLLVERLLAVLHGYAYRFEIILVNDGSRDSSWQSIKKICQTHKQVVGINLSRNSGQHNAVLCGIRNAKYSICVTLDDDLQFRPEDIPSLITKLDGGYDVVYGSPQNQQHGLWRTAASQITKLALQKLMGAQIAPHISPFRAFRTRLREAFRDANGDVSLVDGLLAWGTTHVTYVKVQHDVRAIGTSNYTFAKLILCAFNMITGFTTIPLRIATINGIICMSLGVLLLFYVFYRFIENGGSVPGFPFIASVTIIFSGSQLFALGIIGEYLARMYTRMLNKPPYVISEIVDNTSIEKNAEVLDFAAEISCQPPTSVGFATGSETASLDKETQSLIQ